MTETSAREDLRAAVEGCHPRAYAPRGGLLHAARAFLAEESPAEAAVKRVEALRTPRHMDAEYASAYADGLAAARAALAGEASS